ncbi:high-potential iron-sulfur protein [Acidithiobacillus sulfuriphilus]|uniref:high-potential iron-sulfur protein n=1 Tax=Acidithiobacillus sulfuriphilus TaxID=1867749 RepID=UPI003F63DB95
MEHRDNERRKVMSRRKLLEHIGIIVGTAALGTTIGAGPAYGFHGGGSGCGSECNSPPKHSKAYAMYQDHPGKDGQSCVGCVFFSPAKAAGQMGSCSIVSGEISPFGWCRLFVQQQAPQFPGDGAD